MYLNTNAVCAAQHTASGLWAAVAEAAHQDLLKWTVLCYLQAGGKAAENTSTALSCTAPKNLTRESGRGAELT